MSDSLPAREWREVRRVLLVEGDPAAARATKEMLRTAPLERPELPAFEVACCTCLAEAVEYLQREATDLVLLDPTPPDCRGLEGFYAVQAAAPDVPVVILARDVDGSAALEAIHAGCQEYLVKGEINALALGRTIAYAVERHRRAERRVAELSALNNMAAIALAVEDESELFQRTLDEVFPLRDFDVVGILTLDRATGGLDLVEHRGASPELLRAASELWLGDGIAGKVAQSGEALAIADLSEYSGPLEGPLAAEAIQSVAAVPLNGRDGVAGVISLGTRRRAFFDEERLELLTGIANQVALGLDRLRLLRTQREALQFSQLILQSSPLGIITYDDSGQCVTANAAAAEIVGATREQLLAQSFREIASWRESGMLEAAEAALESGERRSFEAHLTSSFGREIWIEAHFSRFAVGGRPHLLVVYGDSSERRRAEEEARATETRYRRVVENMNDALVIDDVHGNVVFANDQFLSLIGVERQALDGMKLEDYVAPELWGLARERHDRRVRGEAMPAEGEIQLIRSNGRRLWVEVGVTRVVDERGRTVGTQAVLRDISERKEAEESRSRLVAILDATPDFVAIGDAEGRALYLNRSARGMLGLTLNDGLLGARLVDGQPAWARQLVLETALPAALRDGVWQGGTAFLDREGREIPVSQVVLAHRDGDGRATFLSTIARDLSKQKQLEEQLRLAQKMEAVGRLAGGVAHDFNNLLTAILGYSELLLTDPALGTLRRAQVEEIARAGARAAALTRQLLAFSRREAVRHEVLELNALAAGLEPMIRRLIGEDVEFSTVLDEGSRWVFADPGQIEQVLLNLVVNGRDAMPEAGSLSIRTTLTDIESEPNTVPPLRAGAYVALEVRDTGHGMDRETRERIFEPFFTTKPVGKGTGLGLSTVFGIVEAHGGGIAVDSIEHSGTTFTVYLPLADEAAGEHAPKANFEQPGAVTPARILVVEDEQPTGMLVQRLLERRGYEVHLTFSPAEALQLIADPDFSVDLLLTDVVMPEMSGPELIRQVRSRRSGVAVLLMSGYTADRLDDYDLERQEVHFLHKPFRGDELYRKVEQVLASARGSRGP